MTWGHGALGPVATALPSARPWLRAPHSGAQGRRAPRHRPGHDAHLSPDGTTGRFSFIRNDGRGEEGLCGFSLSRLLPSGEQMEANLPRSLRREGAWTPRWPLAGPSRGHCLCRGHGLAARRQNSSEGVWLPPDLWSARTSGWPLLQDQWPCQEGEGRPAYASGSQAHTPTRRARRGRGCGHARRPALPSGSGQKRWRGWGPKCMGRLCSRGRCMGANS